MAQTKSFLVVCLNVVFSPCSRAAVWWAGRSVQRSAGVAHITFSDSLQKPNLTISPSAIKSSTWRCSADTEKTKQADSHLIVSWIRES